MTPLKIMVYKEQVPRALVAMDHSRLVSSSFSGRKDVYLDLCAIRTSDQYTCEILNEGGQLQVIAVGVSPEEAAQELAQGMLRQTQPYQAFFDYAIEEKSLQLNPFGGDSRPFMGKSVKRLDSKKQQAFEEAYRNALEKPAPTPHGQSSLETFLVDDLPKEEEF